MQNKAGYNKNSHPKVAIKDNINSGLHVSDKDKRDKRYRDKAYNQHSK